MKKNKLDSHYYTDLLLNYELENHERDEKRSNFLLLLISVLISLFIVPTSFSQTCTSGGDETIYGNGSWRGYVYDYTSVTGTPVNPFQTYKGYVTEPETFNENWGNLNPSCANGNDYFAVRYRMTKNFPCGKYKFTIGGDDGVRLSINGGSTWLVSSWSDHSYATYTSAEVSLNGNTDLVLEFYEKAGVARVSFSYTVLLGPSGIDAGTDVSICPGASVTLNGVATAPVYGTLSWTGGAIASGSTTLNPVVNPISTKIYTVTSTLNGCTLTDDVLVTVKPSPSATISSANLSICHGNNVTLSGTVSIPNSTVNINNGVGAVLASGTNWSTNIIPNLSATYSINSVSANGCLGSSTGSTSVNLPPQGTTLAINGESATCNVNAGETVHFYENSSGRLITTVKATGTALGSTTATAYVNSSSFIVPACDQPTNPIYYTATMGRRWVISPENQGTAIVTLPFNSNEYASLQTASATTNLNPNDNTVTISDLKLSKYSGTNENGTFLDNCGNGVTNLYSNSSSGNVSTYLTGFDVNGRFAQYAIPSFSEFWLHGGTSSPLPVTLTNFSATCNEFVTLSWTTASEKNADRFVIEKSRDGLAWTIVAEQTAAGNSNTIRTYNQIDENNWNGVTYYRLRQVDFNGDQEVFGPISVSCEANESSLTVYPNPNNGSFTVEISTKEKHPDAFLYLTDMLGKIITSQNVNLGVGTTQIMMDHMQLQKGTYLLTLKSAVEALQQPVKVLVK